MMGREDAATNLVIPARKINTTAPAGTKLLPLMRVRFFKNTTIYTYVR